MWDDVIIGKGEHICSSFLVYDGPETKVSVSANSNSYWISSLILDGSIKIFKDTREGKKLAGLLHREVVDENKVSDFLNGVFLKHVKVARLVEMIKEAEKQAYENGKEMKADEIRRALGVYKY